MRGEQHRCAGAAAPPGGSPPRARGAGHRSPGPRTPVGITPACAGSSWGGLLALLVRRDHPRVRGEQAGPLSGWPSVTGSPPRARGAGHGGGQDALRRGITPACAGSSPPTRNSPPPGRDHPRVRGEQPVFRSKTTGCPGSPPRARGADRPAGCGRRLPGITPACAGSSAGSGRTSCAPPDHPRVRGEQELGDGVLVVGVGSPPRARGAAAEAGRGTARLRITPACAGSRLLDLRRYRSTSQFSFTRSRKAVSLCSRSRRR